MSSEDKPEVIIYTDGACSGNPGPGGWGVVLKYKNIEKELSGREEHTTNNRMELTAVIKALAALKKSCKVFLHSDSSLIINAFNEKWLERWKKKDWKTKSNNDRRNKDLWLKILELVELHDITWIKVKGHADDEYNKRADRLARKASKQIY